MGEKEDRLLPFVNRSQLAFSHGATFRLQIRHLGRDTIPIEIFGFSKEGQFKFVRSHAGDSAPELETFALSDIPIFVSVRIPTSSTPRGAHFVKISLIINDNPAIALASGYVTSTEDVSWPGGGLENSLSGKGQVRTIVGDVPSAGNNISFTMPNNSFWRLQTITFSLTTDANVAARRVVIEFTNGSNIILRAPADQSHSASNTRLYVFSAVGEASPSLHANVIYTAFPQNFFIPRQFGIVTDLDLIQVGDQFTAPVFYVEQWLTN